MKLLLSVFLILSTVQAYGQWGPWENLVKLPPASESVSVHLEGDANYVVGPTQFTQVELYKPMKNVAQCDFRIKETRQLFLVLPDSVVLSPDVTTRYHSVVQVDKTNNGKRTDYIFQFSSTQNVYPHLDIVNGYFHLNLSYNGVANGKFEKLHNYFHNFQIFSSFTMNQETDLGQNAAYSLERRCYTFEKPDDESVSVE
jgi:hypothetical protein